MADALRALWQKLTGTDRRKVQNAEEALLAALRESEAQAAKLEQAGRVMDTTQETMEGVGEYSLKQSDSEGLPGLASRGRIKTTKQEWRQIQSAQMQKYAGMEESSIPAQGYVFAHDHFYVIRNYGLGDFTVKLRLDPAADRALIKSAQEVLRNEDERGFCETARQADGLHQGNRGGRGRLSSDAGDGGERADLLRLGEGADAESDATGVFRESGGNRRDHDGLTGEKFSLKDQEKAVELERENQALRERYEYWKKQTRRSDTGKVSEEQVTRFARQLMENVGVKGDHKAVALKMQTLYDGIASGHDIEGGMPLRAARRNGETWIAFPS